MTTETEPMVKVLSVICEDCGFEYTPENSPGLRKPLGALEARNYYSGVTVCVRGCGKETTSRVATEPVR